VSGSRDEVERSQETSEVCPECDGTSWSRTESDGISRVTRCSCWVGNREESVMAKAGVPSRYLECALDARTGGNEFFRLKSSLERAHKISERWADSFPDSESGLLFTGPPGVGKTHLSVAILRRILIERKIAAPALFCDYRSLLREIKGSYHPDTPESEMQILRPVLEAEPLVLDDLGGESPTLWVLDTFFHILNRRYNEKKLTIITTNYSDRPMKTGPVPVPVSRSSQRMGGREDTLSDRVTARLRSRLYEMCRDVRIDGDDYRQSTLQANFTT